MEAFVEDTKKNFLEIGKNYEKGIEDLSERLQRDKINLERMYDHLIAEVRDLKKRDLETFEKKTDLLQVRAIKSPNILNFGRTG